MFRKILDQSDSVSERGTTEVDLCDLPPPLSLVRARRYGRHVRDLKRTYTMFTTTPTEIDREVNAVGDTTSLQIFKKFSRIQKSHRCAGDLQKKLC